MAKFKLHAGADIEMLTQAELDSSLKKQSDQTFQRFAGIKPMRFQLQGTPASSALTLGDPGTGSVGGVISGPQQGYVWTIKHLVIEGLTASATTPDVMNVYRNSRIVWQLNGNQFCQTFGLGEILLNPGEVLYFKNSGNLAATGTVVVHGTAWETPAEMLGKLV